MGDGKFVTNKNEPEEPRNIFSLFPKFELKIPLFNQEKKKALPQSAVKEEPNRAVSEGETENGNPKPNFVRFPNTHQITTPPFGVELEERSGRTHNPIVIWQVYALGGFIILKWVWARWKERKERAKKATSDDYQSSDEYQSSADDNE